MSLPSRRKARRWRRAGLHYELLRIETHYQFYKRDGSWNFEPVKTTKRVADGSIDTAADKPARIAVPVNFGRYRLEVSSRRSERSADLGHVRRRLLCRGQRRHARHARRSRSTSREYQPGDTMTVAVTARNAGAAHAQRRRRQARRQPNAPT